MIDCNSFERMFPEATAGKLSPQDAAAFAEHQRQCRYCATFQSDDAYYRMRLQTVAFEPNVPAIDYAAIMNGRTKSNVKHHDFSIRTLALAAGIVLGAFVAGRVLYRTDNAILGTNTQAANSVKSVAPVKTPMNPQQFVNNTANPDNKVADSIKLKSTQRIPEQFPGSMQTVNGK